METTQGMSHRERVMTALAQQGTDRLPYDFRAEPATVQKVLRATGERDIEAVLRTLDVDIRYVDAEWPAPVSHGGFYQNLWGERFVLRESEWGPIREDLPGALSNARSLRELKDFEWPNNDSCDYSRLAGQCQRHAGYATVYGFADIWQRPLLVRGMENGLADMLENPDWVHYLARVFTDFYKEDYVRAYAASGGAIDIFLVISDLGSQGSPLISMRMFDDFVAPYLKELSDVIHNLGARTMFHSCGMVYPFIERLIDIGIDILDPIQPVSPAMEPGSLARSFGGRICFHGGIDIQGVLVNGGADEVVERVRHYERVLGARGGYICCPSHLFQPDTPVENIYAMYGRDQSGHPRHSA